MSTIYKQEELPAYPCQTPEAADGSSVTFYGLTKREAFAMAAMQGMLAGESDDGGYWQPHHAAKRACEMADALLAALRGDANG